MKFAIINKWSDIIDENMYGRTMTHLKININDLNLTENFNIWSQTVEEDVLVSAAPLALWFLQSWWRILYEPLQYYTNGKLDIGWRMAHEIGAANNGYVWPRIAFVSDLENIFIFAQPTTDRKQSVRYINGLDIAKHIKLNDFKKTISEFIEQVIDRLDALKEQDTTIKDLWNIILEESSDYETNFYRKVEAMLGYDPDEANSTVMEFALQNFKKIGENSLEELAPVYGKLSNRSLLDIEEFFNEKSGIFGKPEIELEDININKNQPWKTAKQIADSIRKRISISSTEPFRNEILLKLLGIASDVDKKLVNISDKTHNASVGVTNNQKGEIRFFPRKKHPYGRRFEMARFLGDYLSIKGNEWLVCTDTNTIRQKYQRAFAAELLCPLDGLIEILDGDFSPDRQLDVAEHFEVGEHVVSTVLANAGLIEEPFPVSRHRDYIF